MRRRCFMSLLTCVLMGLSSAIAFSDKFDVEGAAEDIGLYIFSGDFCGIENHEAVNKVGNFYLAVDRAAFDRGALRASLIFKGLRSQSKQEICTGVRLGRPKMEKALLEQAEFIRRLQEAKGKP
jgi:hypothetical protein